MFDGLAEWLGNITWPLVTRVFASMGLGTITFTGAESALDSAIGSVVSSANSLSAPIVQLLTMAGFFDALAIMSGSITGGLAWLVMKRWAAIGTGAASAAS